jgi:hypothetical protein
VWEATVPRCLGYQVERRRRLSDRSWGPVEVLRNRVGFEGQRAPETAEDLSRPSSIWPFQTWQWTDHGAEPGDELRYRVCAVRAPKGVTPGSAPLEVFADSGWSPVVKVTADCGRGVSAWFNRGTVMSQYLARLARKQGWSPADLRARVSDLEAPIRWFLSGQLRIALLGLLDEAIADPACAVHAALYELSDEELVGRLALLRGRAHVVLANGSDRDGDGNAAARRALRAAKVDVRDRLLKSQGLGHNKFVVLTRGGAPEKVLTGSANWSPTGLCTQVNDAVSFADPAVAAIYLRQWEALAAAGSGFPPALVAGNAASPQAAPGGVGVWFTRVRDGSKKGDPPGADLQALVELVERARSMVLFVMFQPGKEPLTTLARRAGEGLFVRGVVNQAPGGFGWGAPGVRTAIVQPDGVSADFGGWLKEVTREEFLLSRNPEGIGHAITHSKVLVIDPFERGCVVVTGSHNFSRSASEENDENFVVVRGNRRLAEAYAVACAGVWDHYGWRAHVNGELRAGRVPWSHLRGDSGWQREKATAERRRELGLWVA